MKDKNKNQDWPNLARYRDANAALKTAGTGTQRIVFMGDSITQFWSEVNPAFFSGKSYINRGISGQTTPQMLLRFRADVIAIQPTAVVILAGINDIAGNTGPMTIEMTCDNIFSMIELAKVHSIEVILCSILPANNFPWIPNQSPAERIIRLNQLLQEYAYSHRIIYVDYYNEMVDEKKGLKEEFSNDGVHPNKKGYLTMGPIIEEAIAKLNHR